MRKGLGYLVGFELLLLFTTVPGLGAPTSRSVTETYCLKAGVISPTGRENVFRFVNGVTESRLLSNLVDFSFFCADQNVTSGLPVSLNNTGVVVGSMNRLRGGYEFPNNTNNYGLYFTNLPPTPNGRTVIVWGTPAFYGNVSNNVNDVIFELTGPGGPVPTPNPAMSFVYLGASNPNAYVYNGDQQVIGPAPTVWTGNSIFASAISSGPGGAAFTFKTDYPRTLSFCVVSNAVIASPTVLRIAIRSAPANTTCGWPGLIRGFAYFDKVLTTNDIAALDMLIPRIGVIFEGDSKTVGNSWPRFYCQTTNTWGLYSILTNSAVGGTVVSALNAENSMEARWRANSIFRTNQQYPRVIYNLRGGHNDFSGPGIGQPTLITNAFKAITNLWALARSNGCTTVGWTIDRTGTTWSGNNSNLLMLLNGWIREHRSECDAFMDAENWFVQEFGDVPYTNYEMYSYYPGNTVHETALGAELLGRTAGSIAAPGIPAPQFTLSVSDERPFGASGHTLEVRGAPVGVTVEVYGSPDLLNWNLVTNLLPKAGWAQFTDSLSTASPRRFYRALTSEER